MNAPWNPGQRSGTRDSFTAFVCDDATVEALRPVVAEIGWPADRINKGGLRNAIDSLSVSASPHVLLVDLSETADPLNDINALAEVCEPGTIVIAAGTINDVRLYRDLIASGLQDYLLKPLSPDAVRDALLTAQALLATPKAQAPSVDKPRRTTAVLGVRGGIGTSSIATSVAWLFAEKAKRSTALLDLDVQFGTGALAFDLEPGRGLTDALESPSRIDALFIERAMVRAGERLALLSAEASISHAPAIDGGALFQLHEELKGSFESIVIDLPRSVAIQNPHLLGEVQDIVLVTEQTLASTRDAIRMLGWLKSNAPASRVIVAVNRLSGTPAPEVSRKDFEASIERGVDIALPLDPKLAVAAARQGKCLADAAKGSKLGASLDELSRMLLSDVGAGARQDDGAPKSLMDKLNLKGLLGKSKAAA